MDDDNAFGDFDAAPAPAPPATAEAQGFGSFSEAISMTTAPDPSRHVVTHAGGDDDAEFGAFATVETHPSPTIDDADADADADDDGFADFAEAPAPPTPPAADDDFGDFGDAPPPSAPTPPPAPVTPAPDDLVALRGPAFTAAAEATLARAFPRTPSTSYAARTPKSNLRPTPTLEQAVARAATFATSPAFAGVLDACGVGATPAQLRARIGPRAWESSPAREDLIAALRGSEARRRTGLDNRATNEANADAGREAEASDETNVVATARLFDGLELREETTVEAEEPRGIVPPEASSAGDRSGEVATTTMYEETPEPVEPADDFGAFEGETSGETAARPAAVEEDDFADFAVAEAPAAERIVTEPPEPVEPADDFGAFEGEPAGETAPPPVEEEDDFADFAVAEAPAMDDFRGFPAPEPRPVDDFADLFGPMTDAPLSVSAPVDPSPSAASPEADAPAPAASAASAAFAAADDGFGDFAGADASSSVDPAAIPPAIEIERAPVAPESRSGPADDFADLFGPIRDAPIRLEASSGAAIATTTTAETDAFGDFDAGPPPTPSASDPFGEMMSSPPATVKPATAFDFDAFAASPAPPTTRRDDDDFFGAFGSSPAPALEPAHASAAEEDFGVFASAGGVGPATPGVKSREAVADPFAGIDFGNALRP